MNDRFDTVFEPLEPRSGGLERLRSRLQAEHRREVSLRRVRRAAVAAGAVAIALGTLLTLWPSRAFDVTADFHPGLVRLGLQPAPDEPVSVAPEERQVMALKRVPVADERVVLYQIASLARAVSEASRDAHDGRSKTQGP